jgi:hypothetical protein
VRIGGQRISSAEFHGIDMEVCQFLENVVEGQLRQQRGEYADSHGIAPSKRIWLPLTEYHHAAPPGVP